MIPPMRRRFLHILFRLLTLLSSLLFIATLFLWLRSYWREDAAKAGGPTNEWSLESTLGSISISYPRGLARPSGWYWTTQKITPTWEAIRRQGFFFRQYSSDKEVFFTTIQDPPTGDPPETFSRGYIFNVLIIPYWAPTLLFAGLPAFWLFQHRPRRLKPGLCPKCRYDLRAHAPGQKCPECGTLIETPRPPRL
jgi:hypothetical protein